jgi:hypothetical protein
MGAMAALAQLALALLVSSAVCEQPPYVLDLLPAALPAQQAYRNATLSSCERFPTPAFPMTASARTALPCVCTPPLVRQLNPCAASACAGGGNAVKDPKTGVYHAFFAAMRNEPGSKGVCNLGAWTSNSEVIHVTSSSPTGPFKMQDVALPPWHHNPQAILHPDGHWLLYTIGTVGVPPQKSCGVGAALADRPRLGGPKTGEYVQCHYSQSPSGPWTFLNITKDASNPGIFGGGSTSNSDHGTNPTPVVLANGTVVIGAHDNRGFYVQVGPTWRGPFTRWPGGYLFEFECAPNCPSAHGGGKPHGPPAYVFEVRKRPSFLPSDSFPAATAAADLT